MVGWRWGGESGRGEGVHEWSKSERVAHSHCIPMDDAGGSSRRRCDGWIGTGHAFDAAKLGRAVALPPADGSLTRLHVDAPTCIYVSR